MKKKIRAHRKKKQAKNKALRAMITEKPKEGENAQGKQNKTDKARAYAIKTLGEIFEPAAIGWHWLVQRFNRDNINVAATVILAAATIGIWLVAVGQWSTAEKTDGTLKAAQRPWMKFLPIEIIAPLHYQGVQVSTKIRFHLQNSGNSPALHVIPAAKLVLNDLGTDKSQRVLCDPYLTPRMDERGDQGFVSFPGNEPIEEEHPISARLDQMDRSGYINRINIPGQLPEKIFFTIVSCLTYRFSPLLGNGEPHQTRIIFNLLTKKQPLPQTNEDVEALAIQTKWGDLQPDEMITPVWHLGSQAN